MSTFLIVDAMNVLFRAKFATNEKDPQMIAGLTLHIMFKILMRSSNLLGVDHIVFCFEGKSWRHKVYPPYKAHRKIERLKMTDEEIEAEENMFKMFDDFQTFLTTTNVTVLQHPEAEADDLICRFIATHPNDNHVICSSDADFVQLISDNVKIFDGVRDVIISKDGVKDSSGKFIEFSINNDGRIKVGKKVIAEKTLPREDWIEYGLFAKCVRGDKGDNIFPAYPGVRQTSKKNIGINEAWDDRDNQGFSWNNFMKSKWVDHLEQEHQVGTDFQRNKLLIDMNMIPDEYKAKFDDYITSSPSKSNGRIGILLMQFCGKYDLKDIIDSSHIYSLLLSKTLPV
jgi:5'-3' exonuclease